MEYWMCASSDWLQSCGSISKIIIIIQINFMYSLCHKSACTLWCFCKVLVLQIYAKGWLDVSEATSSLATRRNTSRSVVLCTLYLHTLTHMCHMNYVYPHDVDCKEIISVYTHWPVQEFCHDNSHKIHSSCTCAYMHAHTHTRIYIYTSMHAHSHSHTHTHTHVHTCLLRQVWCERCALYTWLRISCIIWEIILSFTHLWFPTHFCLIYWLIARVLSLPLLIICTNISCLIVTASCTDIPAPTTALPQKNRIMCSLLTCSFCCLSNVNVFWLSFGACWLGDVLIFFLYSWLVFCWF